jgi:hypothetical protein
MVEEPKTMQELHQIQVKIHEEMKNLAPGQRAKKANESAREFAKRHNLKLEFISKH